MPNDKQHRELYDLLATAAEGELSPDQLAHLESLTADDPDARRIYRQTMYALAYLEHFGASDTAATVDESQSAHSGQPSADNLPLPLGEGRGEGLPEETSATPRPKSMLQWASRHPKGPAIAIAVAVMVMIVGAMAITPVSNWIAGEKDAEPTANSEHVAILNDWRDAKWLEGTRPPLNNPRLVVGRRLAIESGLIEVTYLTGAKVVIEGPAEFFVGRMEDEGATEPAERLARGEGEDGSLDLANSGYLRLGKLVAHVQGKKAKGFTIDMPAGSIEDLGTEFGVAVDEGGAAEVEVFEGEIRLRPERGGDWHLLSQGDRRRVNAAGEVISVTADDSRLRFVQQMPEVNEVEIAATAAVHIRGSSRSEGYDTSAASHDHMILGASGGDADSMRGLLEFDLSGLPDSARILQATLSLAANSQDVWQGSIQNSIDKDLLIDVHRVASSVDLAKATWISRGAQEGDGDAAWQSTGGDYDEKPLATAVGNPHTARRGTSYRFTESHGLKEVLQQAVSRNGRVTLLVKLRDEMGSRRVFRIAKPSEQDLGPRIILKYTMPVGAEASSMHAAETADNAKMEPALEE